MVHAVGTGLQACRDALAARRLRLSAICPASTTFHGIDAEALLLLLDQAGVCASSGSACLADSDEPSHVVKAMKPDTGASRQTIRFSLGPKTTDADVQAALRAMVAAVTALRGGGGR